MHDSSLRQLFSQLSPPHRLLLLLPAILSSILAGGIAPFMTYVVGQAFSAFAKYPTSPNPSQAAKSTLLHDVGITALELLALGVASFLLGSITSSLWIWTGERNVEAVRRKVYTAVSSKDLVWFDMKMGAQDQPSLDDNNGPMGAGGLMSKFTRETDDVRAASSLAAGLLLQYLTTCLTCLLLAFTRSYALTLVILSALPLLTLVQFLSQSLASPLLASERSLSSVAATLVDRAVGSIATVKAFNAHAYERTALDAVLHDLDVKANKLNAVWGASSALAQFVTMGMFVQGFWFGSKLVREGTLDAGAVMAVFWACLIATSNLQMCIPQFITLAKGKFAMSSLLALTADPPRPPPPHSQGTGTTSTLTLTPSTPHPSIKKIHPPSPPKGEFTLSALSFTYPTRPTLPVLSHISLYLPAHERTFIVGASGSGKSTIAHLLLGLYPLSSGVVLLDDTDTAYLDPAYVRAHVCLIGQGASDIILPGLTVLENLTLGLGMDCGTEETRARAEEACRAALFHEFVRELGEGYDTVLGGAGAGAGGVCLSGGQKQRLAIARARLRNPPVLILDEATSALDPTSRILVFEAMKQWRRDKTTIVITHDLSQIGEGDFVYVLKGGRVVEQGFRCDLEAGLPEGGAQEAEGHGGDGGGGEFRKMWEAQRETGGFLPSKSPTPSLAPPAEEDSASDTSDDDDKEPMFALPTMGLTINTKHHSTKARPVTLGNWMFDVVADLTSSSSSSAAPERNAGATRPVGAVVASREAKSVSRFVPRGRRPSSVQVLPYAYGQAPTLGLATHAPTHGQALAVPPAARTVASRRFSLQFTPTSPTFSATWTLGKDYDEEEGDEEEEVFEKEKRAVKQSARAAVGSREKRVRKRWDDVKVPPLTAIRVSPSPQEHGDAVVDDPRPKFFSTLRQIYPTIPHKPLLLLGLLTSLLSGAMTPLFSFLLSRLLFEVSTGAHNTRTINHYGGIVLGVAALDGLLLGLKYFLMESAGNKWVSWMRQRAFGRVLVQDKTWFDRRENEPGRVVQTLIKDGDDARNLVAVVLGQACVVLAMVGVGMVWALVRGWQLTLVGVAVAPVFAGVMALQAALVAQCELRNKRAREEVARGYYEAVVNVRGIRAMGLEGVFEERFGGAVRGALRMGVRGAFVEGCTFGVASGLIYVAEALLFYVGAVLIARGTYSYLQMVEVLNLVVFTVSIGSQLMAFTQRIAKSLQATSDFHKLLNLSTHTAESRGILRPEIAGPISFNHVAFSYPERADAPVLTDINLHIAPGECIALVGPSGAGKSTLALLLQRLYQPSAGSITIGGTDIASIDTTHLREHISVVSQSPNLFDTTIAENIRYGNARVSDEDVRCAARAANVHEWVMGLPRGYETPLGENASLVSGGQAQRLQIARALARGGRVLILDECTSALDAGNQAAVLEAVRGMEGRGQTTTTTVMVTHKVPVMRMCDRVVLVSEGVVREQGSYEELMARKGLFATLAGGGEWVGE